MKETLDRLFEQIKHGDADHQQWLKEKIDSFLETEVKQMEQKSLTNTSIADVQATTSDVIVYGNGDLFQLICKASSKSQGWMKSTKAMEIPAPSAGHRPKGCVVQTTSEFRNALGEVTVATDSICFVPYVQIMVDEQGNKYLGESYAK